MTQGMATERNLPPPVSLPWPQSGLSLPQAPCATLLHRINLQPLYLMGTPSSNPEPDDFNTGQCSDHHVSYFLIMHPNKYNFYVGGNKPAQLLRRDALSIARKNIRISRLEACQRSA